LNCHENPGGGSNNLNPLGEDVLASLGEQKDGPVDWSYIYALDSDGDGYSNGQELLDPDGVWTPQSPDPSDPELVTNPGDIDDFPSSIKEEINDINLTLDGDRIHITGSGARSLDIEIRLVNSIGKIVYHNRVRYTLNTVSIDIRGLSTGKYFLIIEKDNHSYFRQFFIQ
jgi:hypothetical protein